MINKKIILFIIAIFLVTAVLMAFYIKSQKVNQIASFVDGTIYLNSEFVDINSVTAFDIKVDMNSNIVGSVELGEGYENYVKILWDEEKGHFAAFLNPSSKVNEVKQSNKLLVFEPSKEGMKTIDVEIKPDSLIYIKDKGGLYLK